MEKLEGTKPKLIFNKLELESYTAGFYERITKLCSEAASYFITKGYLLVIAGFLLGRALILTELAPFSIAFFLVVYLKYYEKMQVVLVSLVLGAATISIEHGLSTLLTIVILMMIYHLMSNYRNLQYKAAPYVLFCVTLMCKLLFSFMKTKQLTIFVAIYSVAEATLAVILFFIFSQSLTFLTTKRRLNQLKTEEIVSVIIMIASILTGTIGWQLYGLSIEQIMSRYIVLLFALVAGASIGSTVGVVTGLIFSLANIASLLQMSMLAFAGLLSGLLKEGKKLGAAAGLLVATLLIGMYGETNVAITQTILESVVAIGLLMLTPSSIITNIAKHIPGTKEHTSEQQQYLQKVRDVTSQRVAKFSSVFEALSNSFTQQEPPEEETDEEREIDLFLSEITEKSCQMCHRKVICWSNKFTKTYDLMANLMMSLNNQNKKLPFQLSSEWKYHCLRSDKVIEIIKEQLTYIEANKKLKHQVSESRRLVAEQLQGVSEVMNDFATEIMKEHVNHHNQESKIFETFRDFGIVIDQVEIYSLEKGNIDIDIAIPFCNGFNECDKLIAPILSDILNEIIVAHNCSCKKQNDSICYVTFKSAKRYAVLTGVAHVAKDGGLVSGDSYATVELGSGKYAVAISDGMGNGERAFKESNETLQLLQKILQSGIEEKIAIKSVNSILSLRTTDEIFATLDLTLIDLQTADSKFLKISSIPSFVKSSNNVRKIEASNLPIGMLQDVDVDVVTSQLKSGDIIVMMSDGVYEAPNTIENSELWFKRKIREMKTDDPQQIADLIIEEVIRASKGEIYDDMTVVVTKVIHNTPKWSPIPYRTIKKSS